MDYQQLRKAVWDVVAADLRAEVSRLECERDRRLAAAQKRRLKRVTAKDLVEMAGLAKSSKVAFLLEARSVIRK